MPNAAYAIADLARLSGLNVRTIRYYVAQGLIPGAGESGPGAHYGQGHLDRLLLTRRLQAQHLPLAEIRSRLEQLSDAEVAALLASSDAEPDRPETSALEYIRSILGTAEAERPPATVPPASVLVPGVPLAAYPAPGAASLAETATPYAAAPDPATPASGVPRGVPAMGIGFLRRPMSPPPARDIPIESIAPRIQRASSGDGPSLRLPDDVRPSDVPNPERSQWERLSLGPNIELHVRRPLSRIEQRRVERLITIARQVLRDDRA